MCTRFEHTLSHSESTDIACEKKKKKKKPGQFGVQLFDLMRMQEEEKSEPCCDERMNNCFINFYVDDLIIHDKLNVHSFAEQMVLIF
jgi:hypothetical protein